jgi:surfeit locus 1 family protein
MLQNLRLHRLRSARLLWPTVFSLIALAILLSLGSWQLQRRQWKDGVLAQIAARVHAEPVPLAQAEEMAGRGEDVAYLHVVTRGRFHHDKERYVYAPAPAGLGWHVYTPLELPAGNIVWVNRGFVPDDRKVPATRAEGQTAGEIEVRGLARPAAHPSAFTPANDVVRNIWHWPNLPALSASAFGAKPPATLAFAVDADAQPAPPGGLPRGGVTRLELPNRHLEYAVTWYGLALTLIGVYFAFAAGRLRLSRAAT